jgi:hypothetical protein
MEAPVYATGEPPSDPAVLRQLELRVRPSDRRPAMFQSWRHLLFLHWRFDPAVVARTLPPGLSVHTFEGAAWVGIVPFFMRRVRPAGCPAVPVISDFLELNLRTYVVGPDGSPGVWFYSLDANRNLAVWVARARFHLPYEHARMTAEVAPDGSVHYTSRRRGSPAALASRFRYRPRGPARQAPPELLDFFLVERYLLFASRGHRLHAGRVHHPPYAIQDADFPAWDANVFALDGLDRPNGPPDHAAYSAGVDVAVYALEAWPDSPA